jgi:hypothetical protein
MLVLMRLRYPAVDYNNLEGLSFDIIRKVSVML